MIMLCMIGRHKYQPTKVFYTRIVDSFSSDKTLRHAESWHGYQCKCGKRKIKRDEWEPQSPGITQEAYDWLNDRPVRARVLSMVKGGKL